MNKELYYFDKVLSANIGDKHDSTPQSWTTPKPVSLPAPQTTFSKAWGYLRNEPASSHQRIKRTQNTLTLSPRKLHFFECQTIDEAHELAHMLTGFFYEPERALLGLTELLINAVEHGNLEITYGEKSEGLLNDTYNTLIQERSSQSPYTHRKVRIEVYTCSTYTEIRIEDEGKGFNWDEYLEISPERHSDLHGRGIALSRTLSFDDVQYQGCGNVVIATMYKQMCTAALPENIPHPTH